MLLGKAVEVIRKRRKAAAGSVYVCFCVWWGGRVYQRRVFDIFHVDIQQLKSKDKVPRVSPGGGQH